MSWYFAASAALLSPPPMLGRPISLRPILRIVPAFFCGADCISTCAAPGLASDADGRACSGGGPGGGAGCAAGAPLAALLASPCELVRRWMVDELEPLWALTMDELVRADDIFRMRSVAGPRRMRLPGMPRSAVLIMLARADLVRTWPPRGLFRAAALAKPLAARRLMLAVGKEPRRRLPPSFCC